LIVLFSRITLWQKYKRNVNFNIFSNYYGLKKIKTSLKH